MRFLRSCFSIIFIIVCSHLGFAGDPQWVEVRSPNFSVITDAGERRGRDVALHFEQMRSVFGTLMTRANVNLSVPLQIVAFRSTKQMRQVAPIFNGKPTELAGLFQSGEDRSFIMLDMSVANPWSVVFHEYAHQLLNGNLSFRTDAWFEEGFAEYFSSIEVDNKESRVGKIPEQTYLILQQAGMMKVADLFRVQQYSKTYNESGDHRSTFYAESALVLHYLYDNQQIGKVARYFDALQIQKKPVEQAFQQAFGMAPEQFDKVLRGYLSSGRYRYYPIPTPAGIVAAQFVAAPVSLADARAVLADIHAHSPDHRNQALGEFQDVLKMDPNNASALRGAGYAYLQQHDLENAAQYFRRAVERDSKDPRVHYYYAMLLNQGGLRDSSKSEETKKELQTAIALDPKLADAYSLLGYAQAFSGEAEKGLETMKKAVELSPRNELYQYNLANIYIANRKVEEAIAIFRRLAGSINPEVAMRASTALAQAENFKAQAQEFHLQIERSGRDDAQPNRDSQDTSTATSPVVLPPASVPVRFVKGKLVGVDCSGAPQAVLSLTAGSRSLKLHVRDTAHAIVIGADEFSCAWKNINMAVNYRQRADGEGDVVSVEVQ